MSEKAGTGSLLQIFKKAHNAIGFSKSYAFCMCKLFATRHPDVLDIDKDRGFSNAKSRVHIWRSPYWVHPCSPTIS